GQDHSMQTDWTQEGARRVTPSILHGGRTRTKPFLEVASALRLHVVPPVLAPAVLVMPLAAGLLLAVAHGPDARSVHTEVHQVLLRRVGAPLAEREVVLGGAALVAVSFDADAQVGAPRCLVEGLQL